MIRPPSLIIKGHGHMYVMLSLFLNLTAYHGYCEEKPTMIVVEFQTTLLWDRIRSTRKTMLLILRFNIWTRA